MKHKLQISSVVDETNKKVISTVSIENKTQWYKLSLPGQTNSEFKSFIIVLDANLMLLNPCVNNLTCQSGLTFSIVLLKHICRLYLFLSNDFA